MSTNSRTRKRKREYAHGFTAGLEGRFENGPPEGVRVTRYKHGARAEGYAAGWGECLRRRKVKEEEAEAAEPRRFVRRSRG